MTAPSDPATAPAAGDGKRPPPRRLARLAVILFFDGFRAAPGWMALVTAMLTLVINPRANSEFQRQLYEMLRTRAVSGLKERIFSTSFGNVVIYVEDISTSQVALKGVTQLDAETVAVQIVASDTDAERDESPASPDADAPSTDKQEL